MKAALLLAENITAMLRDRKQSQHDLAQWCRHSDVWVSTFLAGKRQIQLKDLDRIADFFNLATYQLFQPGIALSTERRHTVRRSGRERRISHAHRMATDLHQRLHPGVSSPGDDGRPLPLTAATLGRIQSQIAALASAVANLSASGQSAETDPAVPKARVRKTTDR